MTDKGKRRAWFPGGRRSVRWQLGVLLAIAIIPVLLALSLVLTQLNISENARQRTELLSATHRLADLVEREIDGYIAALEGLATSDALKDLVLETFDQQARALAARRGTAIALRRPDGQQLVNTYVPFGTPLPVSIDPVLREADRRALATRTPIVSDLYVGAVARRPFVLAVVPVPLDQEPTHLLNLAVYPERLSELIARGTPAGWTATVLDRRYRIIARSGSVADYMGRSATPEQITQLKGPESTWYGHRIDGTPMLAAHVRLESGWTASIGVPTDMLSPSAREAWTMLLAVVLLASVLSVGLSLWVSRRFQAQVLLLTTPEARSTGADAIKIEELYQLAHELNDRDRAIAEQLNVQDHLASIVTSSNDAIFTTAVDGTIITWNKGAAELFGYESAEIVGSNLRRLVPADLRHEVEQKLDLVARGTPHRSETVRQRKDGSLIDVSVNAAPLLRDGRIAAISIVAFEITERKRSERQRELLLRELDHRLKNIFATISSLIGLSARSALDVRSYTEALRQRVYALSAAHNLVRGSGLNDSTSLDAITRTIMAGAFSSGQIESEGPQVRLSASAAIAFGMIFNELLTNALKYGALSQPDGLVRIQWRLDDQLHLTWSESGGPQPTANAKPGFGSLMIEQNIRALGGTISADCRPEGIVVSLTCPRGALNGSEDQP